MRLNQRVLNFVQGTLAVLCVAFVGFTVYELVRPYHLPPAASSEQDEPTVTTDASTPVTAEDAPGRAMPSLSAFSEIVERPLFIANRKPVVPPALTPKRPAPETESPEQVRLSAIVISAEQGVALVYTDKDEKLQQLRQGEVFKGWTLADLRPDGIFLKKEERIKYVEPGVAPPQPVLREREEQPVGNPVAISNRPIKSRRMKKYLQPFISDRR